MVLASAKSASGQTAKAPDASFDRAVAAGTTYDAAIKQMKAGFDLQRAALFEKYIGAVERLKQGFQGQGDLINALAADEELKAAKSLQITGKNFPGIERLRPILQAELDKIAATEAVQMQEPLRAYIQALENHKVALTQAGKLQEAVAVDDELKKLQPTGTDAITTAKLPGTGTVPAETPRPALGARDPSARGLEVQRYGLQPAQNDGSNYTGYVHFSEMTEALGKPRTIKDFGEFQKAVEENAVITGFIKVEKPGAYQFRTNSDFDRNELIIGGQIVCKFRDGAKRAATVELKAGFTPIVCTAYAWATKHLEIDWIVPGETDWKPIPSSQLFH